MAQLRPRRGSNDDRAGRDLCRDHVHPQLSGKRQSLEQRGAHLMDDIPKFDPSKAGGIEGFDPDFATPADWAAMYRIRGLQVVPVFLPSEVPPGASWKRPKLPQWRSLQE